MRPYLHVVRLGAGAGLAKGAVHVETGAGKAARDDVEHALERRRDGFGDAVTQ